MIQIASWEGDEYSGMFEPQRTNWSIHSPSTAPIIFCHVDRSMLLLASEIGC